VLNVTFNNFELYICGQFYWWRTPEYPEETTDSPQVIDKLYYIKLYISPWTEFELTTSVVIGTDLSVCQWLSTDRWFSPGTMLSSTNKTARNYITEILLKVCHNYRKRGTSWTWSHGSWIYNYLCNRFLSPLMLWVRIPFRARCTTLCNKVCQWLEESRWFPPDTLVSSTNKSGERNRLHR
jgi:hypothetical protein